MTALWSSGCFVQSHFSFFMLPCQSNQVGGFQSHRFEAHRKFLVVVVVDICPPSFKVPLVHPKESSAVLVCFSKVHTEEPGTKCTGRLIKAKLGVFVGNHLRPCQSREIKFFIGRAPGALLMTRLQRATNRVAQWWTLRNLHAATETPPTYATWVNHCWCFHRFHYACLCFCCEGNKLLFLKRTSIQVEMQFLCVNAEKCVTNEMQCQRFSSLRGDVIC